MPDDEVFTADEVASLNGFQKSGVFHPYTCGKCRNDLVATAQGWRCPTPDCDYQQDWAHVPTMNWAWKRVADELRQFLAPGEQLP